MKFRRRFTQENTGFQMGPMLDIIFILMIQFMVATVFSTREDWFSIQVPTAVSGSDKQEVVSEVVLNLQENGTLYMERNARTVSTDDAASTGIQIIAPADWLAVAGKRADTGAFAQLKGELKQLSAANPELKVIIRADDRSPHGRVVRLLDICADLSIRNVAFATKKPTD